MSTLEEAIPARPLNSGLKDLMEVQPLGPGDRNVLARLREVLIEHNALDRFGVHLLHKHFDLKEDEMLVEQVDQQTRTLITAPHKKSAKIDTIETSWRFLGAHDSAEGTLNCMLRCEWTVSGHFLQHRPW